MKSLFFALLIATTATYAEELKSKEIKEYACELIAENYQEESDIWDFPIEEAPLFSISFRECMDMETKVWGKKYKKLGSKKYLRKMNIEFKEYGLVCDLQSERQVEVVLDQDDNVEIKTSEWNIFEFAGPICRAEADSDFESFNFYKQSESKIKLKVIKKYKLPKDIYIPDYLVMGEPDDGAVGYDYYSYKAYKGNKVVGYVLEYWYANTEGEWATQYILKYNVDGLLLNHLIKDYPMDFEEYPFFDS